MGSAREGAPGLGWTALIESIVLGGGGPRHVATLRASSTRGPTSRAASRSKNRSRSVSSTSSIMHREPAKPGRTRQHWGYAAIETLGVDAAITSLAASYAGIRFADPPP